MQNLPAFPDIPQHTMTLTLGGRTYRYQRTYRPRLNAWYIDIKDKDSEQIVGGRRLCGEWLPLESIAVDFDGALYVRGPDVYRREDLGGDLREVYISPEELEDAAASDEYLEEYV